MSYDNPVVSLKSRGVYGVYHLPTDGAGFPGGQVAVVAILQVHADFLGSLHLELVHDFLSLGNIDPVVIGIAHIHSLLLTIPESKTLSGLESVFFFPWS